MKLTAPLAVGIAMTALGCSGELGVNDTSSNFYATYAEAASRNGFVSGWLPNEMPNSAKEISEAHSIDSNEIWLTFKADRMGVVSFLSECRKVSGNYRLPDQRRTRRVAPWWPGSLAEGADTEDTARLDIYHCPSVSHAGVVRDVSAAVDPAAGIVWYWVSH